MMIDDEWGLYSTAGYRAKLRLIHYCTGRLTLWDGSYFWCPDCGKFASQTISDVALLAGVKLVRYVISASLYETKYHKELKDERRVY